MRAWELDVNDVFRWRATPVSEWKTFRVTATLPDLQAQEQWTNGQWGHSSSFNECADVELLSPSRPHSDG